MALQSPVKLLVVGLAGFELRHKGLEVAVRGSGLEAMDLGCHM